MFRCWSQSQFHLVCGHHLYSRRHTTSVTLVDSGATSSFIDQTFVAQHNIPVVKKSTLVPVEVIDGRTIASGAITHETTPLELYIGKHTEKIVLNIISTPHHPIILGLL